MSRVGERAALVAYRAGWKLVRRMPERLAYACFDRVADVAHRRGGKGVERMRSNYARVRPELDPSALDRLVHDGMRSYLRYWCESFRLPDLTEDDLVERVRTVGDAAVRDTLAAGEPAVMFLGHLGNWDLGGAWSTTKLAPVTTVAERLKPEELFDEFLAFREALGMHILPLTGGGDVFRALTAALREGAFVALLADRDLTSGGVEVDLCGHRARFAVGPAVLAVTTGAALHPMSLYYERPSGERRFDARTPWRPRVAGRRRGRAASGPAYRQVLVFHERVPVPTKGTTREKVQVMTQACADALAPTIRERTEDWHMMQRVFVGDLGPAATTATGKP